VSDRREEKALSSVVSEARAERVPELDWAKIEAKLDALPPPARPPSPSPLRFLVPPLALAAAAAVAFFAWPDPPPAPVAERAPAAEVARPTDGDALAPGSRVEAREAKQVVSHVQRATWTLEPGSVAEVVGTGEVVTIRLLVGTVSAEVIPSARPETFVVEARDVRVAVHGTRFRVALATEGVDVAVTEGRVMVGPRAKPGTGKLLVGPASEHFSPPAPVEKRPAPPAAAAPSLRASSALDPAPPAQSPGPAAPAPVVPEPSLGAVDTAALHAIELTSACFRQRTVASPDGPPVQTTLTVKARPDGSISSMQFAPPLARQVEVCVRDGMKALHGPVSPKGIEVSRAITLGR
jgi:ferric-dicitrate binding protein FerR (iron transport regulator)